MKTLTAKATSAKDQKSQSPVTLVTIDLHGGDSVLRLRLSTRNYNTDNNSWLGLISDISRIDAKVSADNGLVRADASFRITLINLKKGLFNPDKPISRIFSDYHPEKSVVTVYQEFSGEGFSESDLTPLFVGRITSPEQWDDQYCSFDVISLSHAIGIKTIGRVLSLNDYANAPESSVGSFLPIPIGKVKNVPGIPIYKAAETKLANVYLPENTTLKVLGTAGFPTSGTVNIDGEEITYTAKTSTEFRGCSGAVEIHYRGTLAVQKILTYPYLFFDKNFPIKAIKKVYVDGYLAETSAYSIDVVNGIVVFKKKPYFLDSLDSRFWYAHFDEAHSLNKAKTPLNAIDSNDTSDSSLLSKAFSPFMVKQTDVLKNQGQIGKVFVQIVHRADNAMPSDYVKVEIIDGNKTIDLGKLSRPGDGDAPGISGDIDFSLSVVDSIKVTLSETAHGHTFSGVGQMVSQDAVSGVGTALQKVKVNWKQVITFPSAPGSPTKLEYSVTINMANTSHVPLNFKINGVQLIHFARNVYGTKNGAYTTTTNSDSITITCDNTHGNNIQIFGATRTLHYPVNTILGTKTNASTSKSGTVKVTKTKIDTSKLKVSGSSSSFEDFLDITSHVGGDWNWFIGKILKLSYVGSTDKVTTYIIVTRFLIEYAFSKVVYSENVTADIDGIIDSSNALIERPDKVYAWTIKKLLGESASIINQTSLDAAGLIYPYTYKFSGLIDRKQEIRALWKKLSTESRSVFYFDMGKARIFVRGFIAPVRTLRASEIYFPGTKPPFRFKRTSPGKIVNSIDLKFKRDWAVSGEYGGVTVAKDSDSIARYGQRENPELFNFDFVNDTAMAESLRDFYLSEYKNVWTLVEFEAFLSTVDIETYDFLEICLDVSCELFSGLVMGASRQFGLGNKKRPDLVQLTVWISPDPIAFVVGDEIAQAFCTGSVSLISVTPPPALAFSSVTVGEAPALAFSSTRVDSIIFGNLIIVSPKAAKAFTYAKVESIRLSFAVNPQPAVAFTHVGVSEVFIPRHGWNGLKGEKDVPPSLDSAVKKIGVSSMRFNGTNFIYSPDHADWQLGASSSGDFTVEAYVRFSGNPKTSNLVYQDQGFIFKFANNWLYAESQGNGRQVCRWIPSESIWYHIAWVSSKNIYSIYVDGKSLTKYYADNAHVIPDSSNQLRIGRFLTGWMDEVRISDVARYTSNFTPPSQAFVTDANTLTLLHFDGENGSTKIIDSAPG